MKKILFFLPVLLALFFLANQFLSNPPANEPVDRPTAKPDDESIISISQPEPEIIYPIAEFKNRITKKSFGMYITPQNSPISPEKFSGYHTGVDVEYEDVDGDIPVVAITSGQVVTSKFATGYGGVIVVRHLVNNQTLYAIYGHLRPDSLAAINTQVGRGDRIGYLGTGYSPETDGERRHLHFGISLSNSILGYVSDQSDLANWIDPLSLYR